ncbi:MAG: hypothetical protein PHR16_07030 [Methylovulum sp.]|nr:hypothetical protein [Methylovulum sp.]
MKRTNILLLLPFLWTSGVVLAEQSLLEGVAKQAIMNKAAEIAPAATQTVEGVSAAGQILQNTPDTLKSQAQAIAAETAKQKLMEATPVQVQQGIKELKSSTAAAEKIKNQVNNLPKSSARVTKSIKRETRQAINKKVADLLK